MRCVELIYAVRYDLLIAFLLPEAAAHVLSHISHSSSHQDPPLQTHRVNETRKKSQPCTAFCYRTGALARKSQGTMTVGTAPKEELYFPKSEADIKNDTQSLVAVMGGLAVLAKGGATISKTEASFLLWHHALKSADGRREICSAGAVSSCLYVLDNRDCTQVERTSALGLLHALCREESNRESIVVWRSPVTQTFTAKVVVKFLSATDDCQASSMGILRMLLEKEETRKTVMSQIELPWKRVLRIIDDTSSHTIIADAAFAMRFAMAGKDDLKALFCKVGGIKVLLSAIRKIAFWKKASRDIVVEAITGLLYRLLEVQDSRMLCYENDGITLLTSLLKIRTKAPGDEPMSQNDLQTKAYLVGCLWWIFQTSNVIAANDIVQEMNRQGGLKLIIQSLQEGMALLGPADDGKKKKKKKAKTKANPTAELLIKASTGCLRYLACNDANKIIIVGCMVVEILNGLAASSPSTKTRSNAHATLNLLAMLDGCYDYMVECGTSDTFLSLSQQPLPIPAKLKEDVMNNPQGADVDLLKRILYRKA